MAFSNTDPFLSVILDAIGRLAQTRSEFKEINLRCSISRQDIYWRVSAADEYVHDSERQSSKAVTEDRYYQETKALFGFFTSALSALECFFFEAYFVGHAAIDPMKITAASVRERFTRFQLVSWFKQHFPHDSFTQSLVAFVGDNDATPTKIPPDKEHQEIR
jgi:hypothetical protein